MIPQYQPWWLTVIRKLDNACFAIGAPHDLDHFLIACVLAMLGLTAVVALP